jgi:hypothetical protein
MDIVSKHIEEYYGNIPDDADKVDAAKHFYEQAEKDTIERAVEWLKVHAEDYIVNMTGSYPDAPFNAIIGGKCWDELKKAMEKNNG